MAGVRIVQFVHEPFAALYGLFQREDRNAALRRYDGKVVLVFDWGGGTLDLTLCRVKNGAVVQIKNDGTEEVGGDVFDEAIMNGLDQEVRATRALDEAVRSHEGAKARLLDRCERAKIDLSTRERVEIHVPSFFRGLDDEDFDLSLDRSALERVTSGILDKGFERIERVLDDAGYSPAQVALCVATGGMSNMPAVKQRLHEWFGSGRVRIPDDTATLVSEGAARIAADGLVSCSQRTLNSWWRVSATCPWSRRVRRCQLREKYGTRGSICTVQTHVTVSRSFRYARPSGLGTTCCLGSSACH